MLKTFQQLVLHSVTVLSFVRCYQCVGYTECECDHTFPTNDVQVFTVQAVRSIVLRIDSRRSCRAVGTTRWIFNVYAYRDENKKYQ